MTIANVTLAVGLVSITLGIGLTLWAWAKLFLRKPKPQCVLCHQPCVGYIMGDFGPVCDDCMSGE